VILRRTESKALSPLAKEIVARMAEVPNANTAAIRSIRREFSKRLADHAPRQVMSLALELLANSIPPFVAYELVQHHRQTFKSLDSKSLENLGRGIDSWWNVDAFASYLSGPAWREKQVSDELIRRWARSKNRWWRRAALVSTVPLNNKTRGGEGDALRTLMICELLIEDRDDMVVKALSWALRELSKRDKQAVVKFLSKHGEVLAPVVMREVKNKLRTGLKNPRTR
jgi:3-methyladenine DNA glycosylase AlkD